jgi:hypothetical protein
VLDAERQLLASAWIVAPGLIFDGLPFGPARRRDARTQVVEVGLGDPDRERPVLRVPMTGPS